MAPDAFVCPITHEAMEKPVVAADGHSYERAAITQWLTPLTNGGTARSPMTKRADGDGVGPEHLAAQGHRRVAGATAGDAAHPRPRGAQSVRRARRRVVRDGARGHAQDARARAARRGEDAQRDALSIITRVSRRSCARTSSRSKAPTVCAGSSGRVRRAA
jgi:hypothetical protein